MMFKNIRVTNFIKYLSVRYVEILTAQQPKVKKNFGADSKEPDPPIRWQEAKPYDSIPGPKPIPVFGNIWLFLPVIGKYYGVDLHQANLSQNNEYGDIVRISDLKIRNDMLMCFNPKDIETVHRNEGAAPERNILPSIKHYRMTMRKHIFQEYGGIFTVDGEVWQKARSVLNPIFMQPRIMKQYVRVMDEVATNFVENMKILAKKNPNGEMPSDFLNELNKWALESICYVAFDTRIGALKLDLSPTSAEQQFINDALNFFIYLYKIDVVPNLSKYISTPTWRSYIKLLDRLTNFVQNQLEKTKLKIEKESNQERSEHDMSVIESLLKIDKKYALGTTMDMLIGGVDSISRTMAATLYYVASNTECQRKLREEVLKVLPNPDTPITSDELESMTYLRAVLKEAMRISPITIGVVRKTNQDLVLSGYQVPKGAEIICSVLIVTRKEEHYKDSHKFMPERWLRENKKESNINPWTYLPFGFGPRSCIGRRLAQLELEILLARIMRNFELEWHHDEMKFKMNMLYGIDSPLRIRVKQTTK